MNNKPLKCRLGKGRAGGIEEKCRPLFLSDILLNNPRNQPHRHIPIRINPRHHEAHFILLSGKAVIVAAMGDCVDADMETDENSAFVDVRDRSGIFALNLALAQIFLAGVTIYALVLVKHFCNTLFEKFTTCSVLQMVSSSCCTNAV